MNSSNENQHPTAITGNALQSGELQRFGVPDCDGDQRIGFFLPDTFGMLPFISALEPLRAANRYSGKNLYSWHFFGQNGSTATANNGMTQQVEGSLEDAERLDRLIICGPHDPLDYHHPDTFSELRRLAQAGTMLGAIDTGSYLLARAQLIKDRRCTLHWENMPGFREEFPTITCSSELFEIDDNLFTCAGGDASLDMMLHIIGADHDEALAKRVSELFIHSSIREANEPQRMDVQQRTGLYHQGLVDCVELMEANIEQPLTTQELSEMIGISKRQLERLFRSHLDTTPTSYYQQLRLRAAKRLLEQTTMSVLDVALASGFSSAGHFSKRFRVLYGISPKQVRQ